MSFELARSIAAEVASFVEERRRRQERTSFAVAIATIAQRMGLRYAEVELAVEVASW